ncbi:MAG: LCP family protein [Aeromicrobium sp.]|uniref:LCP family protein n=1 Tax=Aeromicrobium sp. TaxID=1871063 RepID=UPI0039E6079E
MGSRKRDPYAVPDYGTDRPIDKAAARRKRIKWALAIVGGLTALVLILGVAMAAWLNSSLGNISKVDVTVPEENRPEETGSGALNILLMGTDAGTERNGAGTSIINDAASGDWPSGKYRSDATMVMHVPSDRSGVYIVSIPRDSYVPIYDDQGEQASTQKINAALSIHGPSGALSTVENLTDIRLDHFAMIDWDGFKAITDALGGVTMQLAEGGSKKFSGEEALAYVRVRKTLPNGDFDRIKRQQNYMRAIASGVLSKGTLSNPLQLKDTLDAVTQNLAVDAAWTSEDIRSLAVSMRSVRTGDMKFVTVPTNGTANDPVAGSIVLLDDAGCAELFDAMRNDTMSEWMAAHPDANLGYIVN